MIHFLVKQLRLFIILLFVDVAISENIDRKYVKCLVCERVIEEMSNEIQSVSSSLKDHSGGYILDNNGKNEKSKVEVRKSEVFLMELMDRLCKKMDEYVRVHHKTTGQLEVIPLIVDGKMNPVLHNYDIVQDGDLESLKFYCESILSEYEEEILRLFRGEFKDIKSAICFGTEICSGATSTGTESPLYDEL